MEVQWHCGVLVIELYAPVNTEVGPAKMRHGTLILKMRKIRAAET